MKEQDTSHIFIKRLPNLPNEEHTECNVEANSSDEDDDDEIFTGKRKINDSIYLNNVSA